MKKLVNGVYGALLVPRRPDGDLDDHALSETTKFLVGSGLKGVVINGATGEYHSTRPGEFARMVEVVSGLLGSGGFLAGIGAGDTGTSIEYGQIALKAGALAVLLPAPHFFRFSQEDIAAYAQEVAGSLHGPVLLYHLPQFTNPYESPTVRDLTATVGNITGIKDSSGSLDNLRMLTMEGAPHICRIVGNDQVLVEARKEGVCDGVISGVAGVLPELIAFLGAAEPAADPARYDAAVLLLQDLLEQLQRFPVPWGLKWIAHRRGMKSIQFPMKLSSFRCIQGQDFLKWLESWWERACAVVPLEELPE